jgi:hypothetical protein
MRILRCGLAAALACSCAAGQTRVEVSGKRVVKNGISQTPSDTHPKRSAQEFRLVVIQRLMERPSPLTVGDAQLHRLGDQAAVDIMKVLGENALGEAQTPTVLDMLHKAFERPAAIVNHSDRAPKAASFLLRVLDAEAQDQIVKQRIAETREFVADAAASCPVSMAVCPPVEPVR